MYKVGMVGMGRNGFMNQIMQSQQDTDKLIQDFEQYIKAGYNPNAVADKIFQNRGIRETDLTAADKKRLERKVEEIWQAYQYNTRR